MLEQDVFFIKIVKCRYTQTLAARVQHMEPIEKCGRGQAGDNEAIQIHLYT